MAVTILRTSWIDDDGSGTTGTVINNAIKTELYNQIDAAFAALTSGGLVDGANLAKLNALNTFTAFGTHNFTAGGTGGQTIQLTNTAAGAGNYSAFYLGTNASVATTFLQSLSSTYGSSGDSLADGSVLGALGVGGLSVAARHAAGAIRFYSGGTTERAKFLPTGELLLRKAGSDGTGLIQIKTNMAANWGLSVQNETDLNNGIFVGFLNAAGQVQGTITSPNSSTVTYSTTSDQRLKRDLGLAEDLTGLRAVVVHDFSWTVDGTADRGIFAQEAQPVFPRAIVPGTEGDDLSRPWMTDYSKFAPDLIVGWQQHDATIRALEARLAQLEQRN